MPVLCDFTVILEGEYPIGYGTEDQQRRAFRDTFNTGGRHRHGGAVLMLGVKGLTRAAAAPEVSINGHKIGEIQRYNPSGNPEWPDNSGHWYTQMIAFDADILDSGDGQDNTIEITSVATLWRDREGIREDYRIRDVICFFHQQA
jgi:hypothetical protein